MSLAISVVVPTYRRPDFLRQCLRALLSQDMPPGSFEVIVADDAADAATRSLVESFQSERGPAICYLPVTNAHGPAAARNVGWRAAGAPVIAFTDDDCQPEPSWLSAGLAALSDADGATGKIIMPLPHPPTDYQRDCAGLAESEFVTANLFCRRDVLAAAGGFDERFTAAWREDSDLHFTLLEHGYRIVTAPAAVVVHPIRPARWGISLLQQRKTLFDVLLYQKHPRLYAQRIGHFPRNYYAICAVTLLAFASLASGASSLALVGLAAWSMLTGHFCIKRLKGASRAASHVAEMIMTSALIPPIALFWRLRGLWRHRVFFV